MNKLIPLLLLLSIAAGCKKKADETPATDYTYDYSLFGKNLVTYVIDRPLALYPANNDRGNYGFINSAGSFVIAPQYKSAGWFSHNRAMVWQIKETVAAGFIDPSGEQVIPTKYYNCYPYFSGDGLVPVTNYSASWGYLDANGGLKLPYIYPDAGGFHDGRAVVSVQNQKGAIDVNGNMAVPAQYLVLGDFSEGLSYAAKIKGWIGFLGPDGEEVISPRYAAAGIFVNGFAVAMDTVNYLYGHIDRTGEFRIPPVMQDALPFWEGLAAVKVDGKWGFTDTLGNMVVEAKYQDVLGGYCEGLAGVELGGKWGFLGRQGEVVIPIQYQAIDVFYCGLAKVLLDDGHVGYIDKTGKTVWKSPILALKSSGFPDGFYESVRTRFEKKSFCVPCTQFPHEE